MVGLAKKAFTEKHFKSPWESDPKAGHRKRSIHSWPIFEAYYNRKYFSYLEYIATQRLLSNHPQITQEAAFCLCHLFLAAREGHLCIQISDEDIKPSVKQVWQPDTLTDLTEEDVDLIHKFVVVGFKSLPLDLLTIIKNPLEEKLIETPLCCYANNLYLQRHWVLETQLIKNLKRHIHSKPNLVIDPTQLQNTVDKLLLEKVVLKEQAEAIVNGCSSSISIITGGPGTGKTFTAGKLIQVYWENLTDEQRSRCKIAVAAPTGKAASNLQKSLNRLTSDMQNCPLLTAKTLHALLGIKASSNAFVERSVRLDADLIIIDESSMIDVRLMGLLLEAVKVGSRIVFLGDQHQLPSVEAGSVFADMIHAGVIPCSYLQTCMRTELKAIIDLAAHVKAGNVDETIARLNNESMHGIKRIALDLEVKNAQQAFLNYIGDTFKTYLKNFDQSEGELLKMFQTNRILSPMRKGPFGVEAINELLWKHFCKKSVQDGWMAIPIMILTNDYKLDLFNGETGTLLRKLPLEPYQNEDYALFPVREGEGVRKIPAVLLPRYEYAFCLSVHKSQGSEFDRVILVMPDGAELFGREVFYTAVTRARKQVEVIGSDKVLEETIQQHGLRLSGVSSRLLA